MNDLWLANLRPRQCRTQNSILPPQHTDADRFMRRKSAIHIDDLPGDDARRGRGQKLQYAREIIGFRLTPQWTTGQNPGARGRATFRIFKQPRGQIRAEYGWCNRIDANVMAAPCGGERPGQPVDGGFRRAISAGSRCRGKPCPDGRNWHHRAAPPLRDHHPPRRPAQKPGLAQVRVRPVVSNLNRHFGGRPDRRRSRCRNHTVQPPPIGTGRRDDTVNGGLIAGVLCNGGDV